MKSFFVFTVLSVVSAGNIRNASFTLYEVYPSSIQQARQIQTFGDFFHAVFINTNFFDILKHSKRILVPKTAERIFRQFLMCRGMNFNVMMDKSTSQYKLPKLKLEHSSNVGKGNINFEKYHRFDVIRSYLQSIARKYRNIVTLEKIGASVEGRDLIAIKISTGVNKTKPMIYIDAGIHGNEWIAPAQALYIIQQLVENPWNSYLITDVDWLIFPVVNPDGYEFSLSVNSTFRKTRSKGVNCIGVDTNRNFDFFWGMDFGSSSDECHPTFRGRHPFSEPEARAVRDLILKYSNRIQLYLSYHASSQVMLYPWSHTLTPPSDANELFYLGKHAASAIEMVSGTHYGVGQIPNVMYPASGDSISWAKGVAGISLSYAIELPPKNTQFQLPLSCIKFVVLEMFEGIKAFHDYIKNIYKSQHFAW